MTPSTRADPSLKNSCPKVVKSEQTNAKKMADNGVPFPILAEKGDWPYIKFRRSGVGPFPEFTYGYFGSESGRFFFSRGSAELDPMLDDMIAELDWATREQKSGQFAKYLADNHATIPLVINPVYFGVSKRVGEWRMTPAAGFAHNYNTITHGEE